MDTLLKIEEFCCVKSDVVQTLSSFRAKQRVVVTKELQRLRRPTDDDVQRQSSLFDAVD